MWTRLTGPGTLAFIAAVGLWPAACGLDLTVEDGYFYLRIAQNLAQGAGSTFDGLHPTNGYHPLWLLCLVPVFRLAEDPVQALGWAHLLQGLLMVAACAVLYRAALEIGGRVTATTAVLGWTALTYRTWWSGLEMSLHALCLMATLYVYVRWFRRGLPQSLGPYLYLGAGLSLTVLARLDSVLLAAVLYLALLLRMRRGRQEGAGTAVATAQPRPVGPWLASVGMVGVVLVVYLGSNLVFFDSPLPVSLAIKQSWSAELLSQDPVFQRHGWLVAKAHFLVVPLLHHWTHPSLLPLACGLVAVAMSVALLGLERAQRLGVRPRRRWWELPVQELARALRPLTPWLVYAGLQYVTYSLSFHGSLRFAPWYYLIQPLVAVLLLGVLLERASSLAPRRAKPGSGAPAQGRIRPGAAATVGVVASVAVLFIAYGTFRLWRTESRNPFEPLRDAAAWSRRNLPLQARIGSWNPGTLAYFSERQVVNLDGLVNSWKFARTQRFDLCRYWHEEGITHLVDLFRGDEAMAPVATRHTYAACAQGLELLWREDRYAPDWSVRAYRIAGTDDD